MLNANQTFYVRKNTGHDRYGQPSLGVQFSVRGAVVKMRKNMEHTTVRADSSQSRGHGDEFVSENKFLLDGKTTADLGDQLLAVGYKLKIVSMHPRFDVTGALDHYEAMCELWV